MSNILTIKLDKDKESRLINNKKHDLMKIHIRNANILFLWIGVVIITILLLSWIWSLLAPPSLQYLNRAQLSDVKTILTSTLLTLFVFKNNTTL